jgi:lambda family phage portal protein
MSERLGTAVVHNANGYPVVAPTLLERAMARVAPQFAAKQYASRVRFAAAVRFFGPGGYNGARSDRQATKNWNPLLDGPDSSSVPDLRPLRARTADLERNDPIAASATNTTVNTTVGTGLRANARIDREYLKLDDAQAEAFERQCDRIWDWFAESRASDLAGQVDFYTQQELALRAALGRGDCFAIRRYVERPGDLLALRVQLIEGDRVSTPDTKLDSDTLVDGVEFDATGRRVRYYIQDQHPGERMFARPRTWTPVEAFGQKSQTLRVLHIMRALRVGQTRGVPFLAPVMEPLKQLSRLSEAELMASVINSFFTVFVKSPDPDAGLQDMTTGTPGTSTSSPSTVQDERQLNLGQGMVVALNPGESIEVADPKRPNAAYDPFFVAIVRQIGAALDIPFEVLLKHFTASYSASRAAMLEMWRAVISRRTWLVRSFCQPVREWVIEEAVLRGYLTAPGFLTDPLARAAYCRAEWTGPSMGQLNPLDEVNAAEKRVTLGISTLEEETAQLTGGVWERKHSQRVKEHQQRVAAGLEPAVLGVTTRAALDEGKPVKPNQDQKDQQEAPPAKRDAPPANDPESGGRRAA